MLGWKIGLANGLFLPTRACVSAVCDTWSCYTAYAPHGLTHGHVTGHVV
ncbi:hypothetical protein F383_33922 [Gossypium arboreum]|uniref:Uncharacterized protein n=1 Tax=Gossypium arboreum TaxID=29729 RepID=A0A0B0N3R0_GOSAR|nr:hypothetical protein F383_33922 [Gossypium arboreum]